MAALLLPLAQRTLEVQSPRETPLPALQLLLDVARRRQGRPEAEQAHARRTSWPPTIATVRAKPLCTYLRETEQRKQHEKDLDASQAVNAVVRYYWCQC